MNHDDIIRMADKAGFEICRGDGWPDERLIPKMMRFAGLVAAAELRRLHEAHDWQYKMAGERLRRVEKLEAQRDALLEALKSTGLFLHHCWCDIQMNDHSFEKLNRQMEIVDAAIKAAEGEKK